MRMRIKDIALIFTSWALLPVLGVWLAYTTVSTVLAAQTPTPKPTPKAPRVTLKAVENPVPAGSFAEVELVGLSKDISKIVEITPTPGKVVEADGKIYFSGLAKSYTVDVTFCDWETRDFYRQKLVITFAQNPNPPNPDPDPKPPVPTPTGKYYFLIVRPDGPASPEFTKIMSLPAWEELAKAGHQYKDKTVKEAETLGYTLPPGTTLPMVVTLEIVGNVSKVVRGPVPFPTTPAAIADLPKGVK